MRAGVYYSNSDLRVEERPRPVIGPGEILVRIAASGVCGSDVLEWYRIKKAPLVLGHEVAGTVAEVGAGVTAWRVGDRVAVTHHVPCNTCPACLGGHHTACATLHTTNFDPGRLRGVRAGAGAADRPRRAAAARRGVVRRGDLRRAARLRRARAAPGAGRPRRLGAGHGQRHLGAAPRRARPGARRRDDHGDGHQPLASRGRAAFRRDGGVSRDGRRSRAGRGGDRRAGWRTASSSAPARRRP